MSNIAKIQSVSRIMGILSTLAAFGIPVTLAVMWATFGHWAPSHPELAHIRPLPDPLPVSSALMGFAISMIPGTVAIVAAWRLRTLFRLYAQRFIFTAGSIRCLRDFAMAAIVFAFAQPLAGALLSVMLTHANPPGQRMLAIRFGSSELTTIFVGCVFLVIAWIMDEGRELAEEQSQFI